MAYSQGQAVTILKALGWRIRSTTEYTASLKNFQAGWALGGQLSIDGVKGPKTDAALLASYTALRAGRGTASAHFSFSEFACKCGGRYSSCPRVWVKRSLVAGLEAYRARVGHAIRVVSGCRCTSHNTAVGGAKSSQHMTGRAADLDYALTDTQVRALWVFSGIGRSGTTHQVRHVDTRVNAYSASPTIWNYAS